MIPAEAVAASTGPKNAQSSSNRTGGAAKEPVSDAHVNTKTESSGADKNERRHSVANGHKSPRSINTDDAPASSHRNMAPTAKDSNNDPSEAKERRGSTREDGRSDRPKDSANSTMSSTGDNKSSRSHPSASSGTGATTTAASPTSSNRHDRGSSSQHQNGRQRQHASDSGNRDHKERPDADTKRQRTEKEGVERSGGGGERGGQDGAKERDDRARPQDQRDKGRERDKAKNDHHSSTQGATRQQQPNKGTQGKDLPNKGRDNRDKPAQLKDKQHPPANAAATNTAGTLSKPDPLSLLSITGKMGHLTPQKSFFGTSRIVDDFEKLNKVGEGTYGVVYRAKDKKTNEIVALKRIRMERENDGLPISSLREIKLLKTLRHDNIVLVKEVAVGNDLDQIFLVMEYCEQDMAALMDNVKKPYTPAEVKCLMYQLLKGIEYCHDHFVIHRDLKLSNLLLNSQGILKIADFGLARSFGLPSRPMTPKVVTLWYRAPELLFGDLNYTTAVDMWSAGCIFGELLKHAPLLPGKVEKQQVDLIIELLGTPHEKIWQGFNKLPMSSIKLPEQRFNNLKNKFPHITDAARSLLSGLLTYDPKKRLSVKQALAHPYFIESPPAKHPSLLPTHPEIRNVPATSDTDNGDAGATGDAYPYPYPYSDPDFLDFEHCKNPVQLEKSVASYLKSHPEPTEQALVAMLTACANLCRTTGTRSHSKATHSRKQQQPPQPPKSRRKTDINKTTATATTNSLASNLLETILQSSVFSSDQVFAIARSIHDNLSTRPHPVSGIIQDKSRQRKLSLQVTNAFLSVCAITGHFDDAWRVLQEMVDSPQGDVKPDLTTYRHVLRAAAVLRRQLTADAAASQEDQARRISSIDTTAQQVVEQAAEALSKKARMAFWIKLGLGGLTGATVCKFTMMAIMALPTSGFMGTGIDRGGSGGGSGEWGGVQSSISAYSGGSVELVKESTPSHMIDSLQSTEGIMEFLATQEVATGIGLAVGMLTAGYFILGSTRRPPMVRQATNVQEPAGDVKEEDPGFKTRHTRHQQHQHHQYHHYHLSETLPRARLFGLYFPDLATTSRDEIRDYLRKSTQS
ncbi:Cyclin-dependent kinase 10 [Mortierella sp. AD031]|nr:Cyclin-dependent kinase 10 [Mortierella sp. AD031]